jgi:hypothetical protein
MDASRYLELEGLIQATDFKGEKISNVVTILSYGFLRLARRKKL